MAQPRKMNRRGFFDQTAAGAAGAAVPLVLAQGVLGENGAAGANEKLRVALIGCGGMGQANLANTAQHPDVVVAAACDVWDERAAAVVKKYEGARAYKDYREVLDQKDIDAVIVATPPHWHTLIAIAACEAGKDMYLQKPMTLHLGESLAVRNAVRRHGRIVQIGTQIHASENYRRVVEKIRAGYIGPVGCVRTFNVMNQGPEGVGHDPNTTPPPGLDWDMWLGPAPQRPFNAILAANSYNHGSWMDISGGWTPNMAPHIIDLPVWALDLGLPTRVHCAGGRFVIRDDGDAPDVQEMLFQYPNLTMTWMSSLINSYGFDLHGDPVPKRRLGIYFHGLDGTMYCNYSMHEIVPEGDRMKDRTPPEPSIPPSPGHEIEWVNCVKTREQPSCNVDYHIKIDIPIVLGNLSYRLGRSVQFDPATESIVGDEEAARLAVPEYRKPWKFPAEYLKA